MHSARERWGCSLSQVLPLYRAKSSLRISGQSWQALRCRTLMAITVHYSPWCRGNKFLMSDLTCRKEECAESAYGM